MMEPFPGESVRVLLEQQPEVEIQALGPLSVGPFRVNAGLGERLTSILSSSHLPVDPRFLATILTNLDQLRAGLAQLRPMTIPTSSAARFDRLRADWQSLRNCNSTTSSLTELFMSPPYQQIIGMGEQAVPYLLDELRREPDHWFWALRAITGVDPVKEEHRGMLDKMSEDWLDWAATREYDSTPRSS